MNTGKLGTLLAILMIGVGGTALAAQAFSGENSFQNPVTNKETRCDLTAKVGVGSAETKLDKIKIKQNSFRYNVEKTGFLLSLTGTDTDSALSLLKAEGVEMNYRLEGPQTDNPEVYEKTDRIGKVGTISASKLSTFKKKGLRQGQYILTMDLNWNSGQDRLTETIVMNCGGDSK